MSSELISVQAWIEKHSFDQKDTFNFLVGKTLDGVIVKSLKSKVSEEALNSYLVDVRAAQKRKPPNKGVKKNKDTAEPGKQEGHVGNITLKKIDRPKPQPQPQPKPKAKEPVISEEPAAEKPEVKKVEKTPVVVDVKPEPTPAPEPEPVQQEIVQQPEPQLVKTQPPQNEP